MTEELNGRKERRVRQMLKTFYGGTVLEADEDPTSVDSAAFDIDLYFNQVMRGQDLAGLETIIKQFQNENIEINTAMKTLVAENYKKFLGVSDTIGEINTKMDGILSEMEKLNSQVDAIASDAAYLDSRFSRNQGESLRLTKMQDLITKLQYMSSIPDRLRIAIEMGAYSEAINYYQLYTRVLANYLHIPSFKALYTQCGEYVTQVSQKLKMTMIDAHLSERESADMVQVLLSFGSSPEQLRALYLFGRTAAIEYHWYAEEKLSTIPGDPLKSLRECNRAFFTHLLMSSYHFKNLFPAPEPEVIIREEIIEPTRTLRSSSSPENTKKSPSAWRRLSSKPLEGSPRARETNESAGRDSPVVALRPDSPRQIETPWEDWNKFVLEHFTKYINRAKMRIMENDNITDKLNTMQALSADIHQVHRQLPELPIQAIDDLVTDVINDHISISFTKLQESAIQSFRTLQTSFADTKSIEDPATAFQEDLEKNTHYILSHLQSVMTEMFSSTESHFFSQNYQVWVTKVQIKLQQFLLTVITECSEMCDLDEAPKHMKPAFMLSVIHLCLFFKKRGLAQIQKTLDNIVSTIERKDVSSEEDQGAFVSFNHIISELRNRCKETAREVILLFIRAHCRGFERMLKKLLETSNWWKAREPREVKLGTALIVDDFFKIFVEVSTLFSILPSTLKRSRPLVTDLRYSATLSPKIETTRMTRAPSLPAIGQKERDEAFVEKLKTRHSRTASALPSLGIILPTKASQTKLYTPVAEVEVAVTFVPDTLKCTATYILFRIVQYIFKSFMERVRTKVMSRGGCQQVDVDAEYMRLAFMKVIPDPRIEGFAKEVRRQAATRTHDPQPLQQAVILQLCKEKAQAHRVAL